MTTIELNATDQSLGRLASNIAVLLRGKHLPAYRPERLPDVTVVVSNIDKIKFTGNKKETKLYHRYSGYPGGLRTRSLGDLWERKPKEVVRQSVYRMLPKNRMRDVVIKNLKFI